MPISSVSSASGSVFAQGAISDLNRANRTDQVGATKAVAKTSAVAKGASAPQAPTAAAPKPMSARTESAGEEARESVGSRIDIKA
jgi:hypothetical protein